MSGPSEGRGEHPKRRPTHAKIKANRLMRCLKQKLRTTTLARYLARKLLAYYLVAGAHNTSFLPAAPFGWPSFHPRLRD